MLDISTLSLILAMAGFVAVAVVTVHHHKNSDQVRRKKNQVAAHSQQLNQKIAIVEKDIVDLKLKLESLDEEIASLQS